jgi:hypothetical protein
MRTDFSTEEILAEHEYERSLVADGAPCHGGPGYTAGVQAAGLYHQHTFFPSTSYESFLIDVLTWLDAHPQEIVVVGLSFSGFQFDTMKPSATTLDNVLHSAQQQASSRVSIGDKTDLERTIGELWSANRRLIFLKNIGAQDDATKNDSWDGHGGNYETAKVDPILGALNAVQEKPGSVYTVLQLQGTASALGSGTVGGIVTRSDASSPLLSTKAAFDNATYPWLDNNVPTKLSNNKLVVFLNDFADNALVSYAIGVTRRRLRAS